MFDSKWDGNYGCSLSLNTGETDEKGYPKRVPIVALKTAPYPGNPEGRKLDISEAFINFVAFEEMTVKPPRD